MPWISDGGPDTWFGPAGEWAGHMYASNPTTLRGDGLAPMPDEPFGEGRLVLAGLVDTVAVLARNVRGGEHANQSGMPREQRPEIADAEPGARVRRADRTNREHLPRLRRRVRIGAVLGRSRDAGDAVDLRQPGAHGMAGGGRPLAHRAEGLDHGLEVLALVVRGQAQQESVVGHCLP